MLRRFRQWLAGGEVAAMAADIEKLSDVLQTAAHRLEGLQLRLERLSNRVNMRMNRAGMPREDERDAEILRELRAARGNGDEVIYRGDIRDDWAREDPPKDW